MANRLRSSSSALTVACVLVLLQAPVIFGWIPRFLTACKSGGGGVRINSGSGVLLSASKDSHDKNGQFDGESDEIDPEILPLFVEGGDQLNAYVSRLEAIYDMDSESTEKIGSTESQRLLEEGERVVLGDWMEWDDGACVGGSCGDDSDQCEIPESYKVSSPKVDVMSFLGIRRAEPLKVQRDWD